MTEYTVITDVELTHIVDANDVEDLDALNAPESIRELEQALKEQTHADDVKIRKPIKVFPWPAE